MATAEQYAKWCIQIIDGNADIIDDIYEAMYDDGFVDENQEWADDDDNQEWADDDD
jgi:hypothetical protein